MRFILSLTVLFLCSCSGVRFVLDVVPATDELTETVVMQDAGSRGGSKIAQIDYTGLIADADRFGLLAPGENPVSRFVESLQRAATDKDVKAVVIRINSPGGTVTASDVLFRAIEAFKHNTHKPVVVSMADVAASGGYYMACAGDEIVAYPTTITGSIGVIIQTVNVHEGLRKIGVSAKSITSGPNKAIASPFEPEQPQHRELLQGLVTEFYENFVNIVKQNRPTLKLEDIESITDGRIVSGKQAIEMGLVDRLGGLSEAFESAKRRASLTSARMVKYHRVVEYVGSAYAHHPAPSPQSGSQINLIQLNVANNPFGEAVGFYYLWDPSAW